MSSDGSSCIPFAVAQLEKLILAISQQNAALADRVNSLLHLVGPSRTCQANIPFCLRCSSPATCAVCSDVRPPSYFQP